jgi:hypothetical protein
MTEEAKFLGLTVDEFEAELKPCLEVRQQIADLGYQMAGAIVRRLELDGQGLALVNRWVNAVKSDQHEGEDSELLEALGSVIKSKRKSGLHRGTPAADSPPLAQAA